MNNFMLRPRALKAGIMRTNMLSSQSTIVGTGWGTKMIVNQYLNDFYTTFHGWDANKWRVLTPGVYRAVAVGDGGGGGAGGATVSPGQVNDGFGGGAGVVNETFVYIRTSSYIRVGTGGAGGNYPTESSPPLVGNRGSGGYGATIEGVVSAGPGGGGDGGSASVNTNSNPSLRMGAPGTAVPPLGTRGGGGDGGTDGGAFNHTGGKGVAGGVFLELVG